MSGVFFAHGARAYYSGSASGGRPGDYLLCLSGDAAQAAKGASGSAVKGSLSGIYLNPASLCYLERDELSFFYRPLYDGGNYYFIGGGHKFGPISFLPESSYMGVSVAGLESAMAEKTSLLRESLGSFNDTEQSFIFSFAYPAKEHLAAGANMKLVTQGIDGNLATSFGADIGVISFLKSANLSLCVQNLVSPSLKLKDSAEKYPRNLIFGASSVYGDGKIKPSADIIVSGAGKDKSLLWKTGCSYLLSPVFSLSAGLNYKELSAGFTVKSDRLTVDYALAFHDLGIKHMLGIKMYFDTGAGDEAKLYYSRRKELEKRLAELQKAKQSYDRLTNSAIEYFLNGNYELAREEFKKAAMLESLDDSDLTQLFKIEMQIDDKVQKQKLIALFAAAQKQLGSSEYEECLKSVAQILNIAPGNKRAVLLQCRCLAYQALNKGDYVDAEGFLNDALTVDPGNVGISKLLRRLTKFIEDKKYLKEEKKK
ncbi:hypothetical protein KJ633_03800 [bacterium]|nr:hypothetical protein [bacterium]